LFGYWLNAKLLLNMMLAGVLVKKKYTYFFLVVEEDLLAEGAFLGSFFLSSFLGASFF